MQEIWKQVEIEPYCDYYAVSNYGNVKSTCRHLNTGCWTLEDKILKQRTNSHGYKRVLFSVMGKRKEFSVHRLVAELFVPNPNGYLQVNHIDGNKNNNKSTNLEWCTLEYNVVHAHKNGLIKHIQNPVYQFDANGNLLKKWDSANDASKTIGVCRDTIYIAIRENLFCKGYYWSYDDEVKINKNIRRKKNLHGIDQYDLSGNFLNHYDTITEIESIFQKKMSSISTCCSGKRPTAYGYIWKYSKPIL